MPSSESNKPSTLWREQAETAMLRSEWHVALSAWKAWWNENSKNQSPDPDAMHDRAICHFHCEDKEEALEWLNQALSHQPDYSYRYSSRGWMKQALGDIHGAIEDYKRAVELDPDDAITWNNLGLLEEQLGYRQQAQERYEVSDELLGILKERGIESERPKQAEPIGQKTVQAQRSFWGELKRAACSAKGRQEVWLFIRNGFTLRD